MAELYNEGLFRKGLVRTSGLVRPDLLLTFDDIFSPYAIDRLEAALALDFDSNVYRTGNKDTTFADAFMGTSPKITYDPGSASSSQSTMVNSSGNIVWAPHNLALNSAAPATQTITVISGADYTVEVTGTGSMALTGAGTGTATDGSPATITASTTSLTITLTGSLDTVAVYRSDLGGMAPVPGAATGFETYVPTNGSAEYLPRVGHHVYNGSAWVNEGLLIESEPRTNLEPNSNSGDPTSYAKIGLDYTGQTLRTTGPDGVADSMLKLQEDTATSSHYVTQVITGSVGTNTLSCIVKDAGDGRYVYWRTNNDGANQWINFNPATGEVTEVGTAVNDYGVIDLDGGFYRIWFSCDSNDGNTGWILGSSNSATPGNSIPSFAGTSEAGLYFGFIQFEAGATPSSYIPTSGSTVIRGGQTLTVPPAEFGWPEPEYIGPELVDNRDFSLGDNGDWTKINASITTEGVLDGSGGLSMLYQDIVTNGRLYHVSFDATVSAGEIDVINNDGTELYSATTSTTHSFVFKQEIANGNLLWRCRSGSNAGTIDNVSVREINPLSVSIQMDGRMTYADDDVDTANPSLAYWDAGSNNYIHVKNNTYGAPITGRFDATQDNGTGSAKASVSGNTLFAPGVLVPFNIASRHGSTFINGAADGTALTADTTPTALPDLSSTDLQIAQDFMGTIGQFRQFAGDVGDTGLVTATNPSTEPTLSLTFDGTAGGSFYNLNWSE